MRITASVPLCPRASRAALSCALLLCVVACSGFERVREPSAVDDYAMLRVQVTPVDATLIVDDAARGRLDANERRDFLVEPGAIRVEVRAEGYLPMRYDLEVEAATEYPIYVELWPLVEEADGERPAN